MKITDEYVIAQINNILGSFMFEMCNKDTMLRMHHKLCAMIRWHEIIDIFPVCSIFDINHVKIEFNDDKGNCILEFVI